jgi:hypothetical protein
MSLAYVAMCGLGPVIHAARGKEPIAEDTEEPRFAEEKTYFVLGDRLFAPSRMNDRVRTALVHLTGAAPDTGHREGGSRPSAKSGRNLIFPWGDRPSMCPLLVPPRHDRGNPAMASGTGVPWFLERHP